jgi:two-component system chemotaxis sensor kinase CheA
LNLTRTFVTQLGDVFKAVRDGEALEPTRFEALLGRIEEALHLHAKSQVSLVTRDTLDLLNLPLAFKQVLTPENLLEVSRALQAGESFYTVLADLNHDGRIGQAFGKWTRSDTVRLITSITVYQDSHSLFNFLLATSEPREVILEALTGLDPEGSHLSLEECALREDVDLDEFTRERAVRQTARPAERVAKAQGTVSVSALADFVERVGELAATRATFHRVMQRLTEMDLLETVTRLVKQSDGDWRRARHELQASLGSWIEDLHTLSQVETEMGMALDQFQETALALRARPAAEILAPLKRLVQNVAQYQGKLVKLELEGLDVGLDHTALDILAGPLHRLVWLAVTRGIERPLQRREMGKPATGRVSIVVRKTADRVKVVVEDDGRGWGAVDDIEGIDLAAIHTELQARQGRLGIVSEPGKGARFSLELPLDMVVIDGMVMRVGDVYYVAPVETVRRIVEAEKTQIVRSSADGGQRMLRLDATQELIPIQTLRGTEENISGAGLLLVVEVDEQSTALAVDELIGQQQVLIHPLQGYLTDVQGVSGCVLLGEGDVGMVLDVEQISRLASRAALC